jgi:hypothetical protein
MDIAVLIPHLVASCAGARRDMLATFIRRGVCYVALALCVAVLESLATMLLSWLTGTDILKATILTAAIAFLVSQWYFLKTIRVERAPYLDYGANLIATIGLFGTIYATTVVLYSNIYNTNLSLLQSTTKETFSALDKYNADFCGVPTPVDVSVTCELVRNFRKVMSARGNLLSKRISDFIDHDIRPNDLGGRIKLSDRFDLEALIPSRDSTPAVGQFNVIYNMINYMMAFSDKTEVSQKLLERIQWASWIDLAGKTFISTWMLFNAVIVKLGLILVKQRASAPRP